MSVLVTALACAGGPEPDGGVLAVGPVLLSGGAGGPGPTPAHRIRALEALRAAVLEHRDDVAWSILHRLRLQGVEPELAAIVDGFERILTGRELVRGLELALERVPDPGVPAAYRLVLVVTSRRPERVTLQIPPADLKRLVVGLSANGVEARQFSHHLTDALLDLELQPGQVRRVELLRETLDPGTGLAVRERWRLEPRAGEVHVDGEAYPAQGLPVVTVDGQALAPYLSSDPLPPAELARYVVQPEVFLPGVLERAVRIAPERREETLDLLTDVVVQLDRHAPERLAAIEPALRWLSHRSETGTDWAAWVERRRRRRDVPVERAVLDLPARDPRGAPTEDPEDGR